MLTIQLRRRHFDTSSWLFNHCPIANALKEKYNTEDVNVITDEATVENVTRTLQNPYNIETWYNDMNRLNEFEKPNDVVREVVFI